MIDETPHTKPRPAEDGRSWTTIDCADNLHRSPITDHRSPITDRARIRRTPLISALLSPEFNFHREIDLTIHPADEMLRYQTALFDGDRDRGLAGYLESGRWAARMTEQIVDWRFGGFGDVEMLDFASGYGRVTRHLLSRIHRRRLTVSDVMAPAVEFQRRVFAVDGVVSAADPARLSIDRNFDVVQAISLFSHLPETLFRRWLRRLWSRTRPGGVLIVSVHDISLVADGLSSERFIFVPVSENDVLDPTAYGSTWVSQSFVEEVLADELEGFSCHRLPRGLCGYQDIYIVVKEKGVDFATLDYEPGIEGYIDMVDCDADSGLSCNGWAASIDRDRRVEGIDLVVGREIVGTAEFGLPRPDVASILGDERLASSGWTLNADLGESISYSHDPVFLVARSAHESTILSMGCVYSLLADAARANLEALSTGQRP